MVVFLFNSVTCVSLLSCLCILIVCLCIFIVMYVLYSATLCCFVYCLCVNVYLKLPPGLNPIAVNKYTKICMALKCIKYSLNSFATVRYNHLKV